MTPVLRWKRDANFINLKLQNKAKCLNPLREVGQMGLASGKSLP